jgi:hypothetical protein
MKSVFCTKKGVKNAEIDPFMKQKPKNGTKIGEN